MKLDNNNPEDKFFIDDSLDFITNVYGGSSDDWFKTTGEKKMDDNGRYSFHVEFIRFNDTKIDLVSTSWKQTEDKSDFRKGASVEIIPLKNIFSIIMDGSDTIVIFPNTSNRKLINLKFEKPRTCFYFLNKFSKYLNELNEITSKTSAADEIKKFKDLLDDEAITEDEFNEFKKKLLDV